MNYEQKYKEALERAKDCYVNKKFSELEDTAQQLCEYVFPELRESEDEKIRKWLINLLSKMQYHHCDDEMEMGNKALAWLEKQLEQKPSWSEEDEEKRELLISILEVNHPNGRFKVNPINTLNMEVMSTKELVNWLKSLKPNRWKPSEEQMKALNAINIFGELSYVGQGGTLVKLYNDLKKL